MLYDDTIVLVFAKAPIAGSVNTRLIPDIGVEKATDLQENLIHQRLSMLTDAQVCDVALMCAPDTQHECFTECRQKYQVTLSIQSGSDIGWRMYNAAEAALQSYQHCVLIGTDAPALDEELIEQAIKVLHADVEVVVVPAEDGGYVLLGMQYAHAVLFEGIDWGSAAVMQQSRKKLEINNISFRELATCWDVDRLEDYQRYLAM